MTIVGDLNNPECAKHMEDARLEKELEAEGREAIYYVCKGYNMIVFQMLTHEQIMKNRQKKESEK